MSLSINFSKPVLLLNITLMLFTGSCHSKLNYQEQHRPQFHFSPPTGWMNDPNGLVYFEGEFHLFYQYYPDSTVWGPMHWGHAISEDLVHWKNLPAALFPDSLGYIFSGSAVIDWKNRAGLQTGNLPAMISVFTQHCEEILKQGRDDFQNQSIAYSNDKGRTFKKYSRNPVIRNPGERDFRDPKVRWDDDLQKWILVFAVGQKINFYSSSDLINWEYLSEFGIDEGAHSGVWECPDLFPLKIMDEKKWVLLVSINPGAPNGGSGTQYFIGNFDGKEFTNDNPADTVLWLDYGPDNYAGVSWSDIPEKDGRRIYIGWMSNWNYAQAVPTGRWRSAMTIPRKLELKNTIVGVRLFSTPVKEMIDLRKSGQNLDPGRESKYKISGLNELIFKVDLNETLSDNFGVIFFNSKHDSLFLGFDKLLNQFYIDRTRSGNISFSKDFPKKHVAPRIVNNNELEIRLFLDYSSLELFADSGSVTMTELFYPQENFNQMIFFHNNGIAEIKNVELMDLSSIWN